MATYRGVPVPWILPGTLVFPICVTRTQAAMFKAVFIGGGFLLGAVIGLIVGTLLGALIPEFLTKTALVLTLMIGGGMLLGGLGLAIVRLGACPCPVGVSGFCFGLVFMTTPKGMFPFPPFLIPSLPGFCAAIPPGCP